MSFPSLDTFFTQVHSVAEFQKTSTRRNAVEVADPIWIDAQGELPSWLNGVLYRIGPGKFILGDQEKGRSITITHAFDGLAYIHRFEFDAAQQKVRYNSRHTAKTYEKQLLENPFGGFSAYGTVYAIGAAWHRFMDFLARSSKKGRRLEDLDPSSQSINVTVTPNYPIPATWTKNTPQQRILVAKTDSNRLQKVNHDTLEPEKLFDYSSYDPRLTGQLSASHHQHDDTTQETFNVSITVGADPSLTVFKVDDATGAATVLAEIRSNLDAANTPFKPAYLHSFWMTQHYVVVPISPIYFRNNGLDLAVSGNLMASMEWHHDTPTLFYVVSRDPKVGHIATVPVDSHFAFHTVHGRDLIDPTTGQVVLELNTQAFESCNTPFQVHHLGIVARANQVDAQNQLEAAKKSSQTTVHGFTTPPSNVTTFGDLRRYTIILDSKAAAPPQASYRVLAKNADFSRVHPAYQFKDYRYVYFNYSVPGVQDKQGERYGIKKIDLLDGQEIVWEPETNNAYVCSEPVFVPRPGATDEDDGVVLSLTSVFDNNGPEHDHCYMLVLHAADFNELARIPLGQFTATTFHGSFVDHEFISNSCN